MLYRRRDTILDAIKVSGITNRWAFVLSILILAYCGFTELHLSPNGVEESNGVLNYYKEKFYVYWAVGFSLVVYSTIIPVARVRKHPFGTSLFVFVLISYGVIAGLLSFLGSMKLGVTLNSFLTAAIPSLALVFTLLILFVQLQVSSNNLRTNHALNSLLQMRDSDTYNKSAEIVSSFLVEKGISQLSEEHVRIFMGRRETASEPSEDDKKTIDAISAQLYILNYFEFLSLGVKSHALDGELIYNSMAGIFEINMYRSKHLLDKILQKQPKAFYCYINTIYNWRPRWDFENTKVEKLIENVSVNRTFIAEEKAT